MSDFKKRWDKRDRNIAVVAIFVMAALVFAMFVKVCTEGGAGL